MISVTFIYISSLVFQLATAGWNDWSEWTTCSATCGHGYHVRSRDCEYQPCVGEATATESCTEGPCATQASSVSCPHGWYQYDTSCYHLRHDPEEFTSAMEMCSFLKSHLVEIDDAAENTFLTQTLQGFTDDNSTDVWIGLTDVIEEGIWRWMQNKQEATYTNWGANQPNNYQDDENCGKLEYFGTWNDGHCHHTHSYICEKPGSAEPAA